MATDPYNHYSYASDEFLDTTGTERYQVWDRLGDGASNDEKRKTAFVAGLMPLLHNVIPVVKLFGPVIDA